jgi:hypothetical protein
LIIPFSFIPIGKGAPSSLSSSSSLETYLGEDKPLVFTLCLLSFAMRHVLFHLLSIGKRYLLEEDVPLIATVATPSLSELELSSLDSLRS